MTRFGFFATLVVVCIALFGCGRGGGGSIAVTRAALAGTDAASPKLWATASLKSSASYDGTGADQPCPVSFTPKIGGTPVGCGAGQVTAYRADGAARVGATGAFDDSWTLDGSTLTLTTVGGAGTSRPVYTVTDEGATDGTRRLRLKEVSTTVVSGFRPADVNTMGFETVIAEAAI